MGPTFSPGTRSDHVFVRVFNTGLLSLFLRQYCLDPLITNSCSHMFHTVRPKAYSFSKLGTLLFVSGFLREVTQKFHFPQSSLKLYGGHIEKIVQYFLRLYFTWTSGFPVDSSLGPSSSGIPGSPEVSHC